MEISDLKKTKFQKKIPPTRGLPLHGLPANSRPGESSATKTSENDKRIEDCQPSPTPGPQIWDLRVPYPGYVCSILEIWRFVLPLFFHEIWRFQSWAIWKFLNVLFSMKIGFKVDVQKSCVFLQAWGLGCSFLPTTFHQSQPYVSWKSYPYQRLSLVIIATMLET